MSTITKHSISNFNDALASFLTTNGVEGFKSSIYCLNDGLPTIGAGYTLITKSTSGEYSVRLEYKADFAKSGIVLNNTQTDALDIALNYAKAQLVKGITNYSFDQFTNLNLTITIDQAKALAITQFDEEEFGHALNRVKKWLGDNKWAGDNETIYNRLKDSKEMLVLADLAYNNFIKASGSGCPSLKNAILSSNRAEAWYEIRYNTGGGLARRIAEAGIFGLYNDPANVTKEDATMIYQMFTRNRDTMLSFEAANKTAISGGQAILESNAGLGTVQPLEEELQTAANYLINEYGQSKNFNPLNIQVSSLNTPVLLGEDTTDNTGSIDDLLIGSDERNDIMGGESGNDVLIGGAGDDTLEGGKGDDILVGGKGLDTYIWSTGDGNDRIIDEGDGIISINYGPGQKFFTAGGFIREGTSNVWKMAASDGSTLTLTHNSPWKLILADGSALELGDFQDGDYGMRLFEEPPSDFDLTLTGTANHDEMGLFGNGSTWELSFTSFRAGVTSNKPFYTRILSGYAPRLKVNGGGSGDFLFG
ncbi:MAG: hemolysin-like protein, partial [uncultured bacterium]